MILQCSNLRSGASGTTAACLGIVTGVGASFCRAIRYVEAGFHAWDGRKVALGQPALLV